MNENTAQKSNNAKKRAVAFVAAAMIALAAVCSYSVYAWFYIGRNAAAVKTIADPTNIFIRSGNGDPIEYLELSNIDLKQQENGDYAKSYVFCVQGVSANEYRLQLAYTTNNQLTFEIYSADLDVQASGDDIDVVYVTAGGVTQHYYANSISDAVSGSEVNRDAGENPRIIAKNNDAYYTETYGSYSNSKVHEYAAPIYWQSDGSISVTLDDNDEFRHYYILRIIWHEERSNNKETDMIYISTKVGS